MRVMTLGRIKPLARGRGIFGLGGDGSLPLNEDEAIAAKIASAQGSASQSMTPEAMASYYPSAASAYSVPPAEDEGPSPVVYAVGGLFVGMIVGYFIGKP
jgi:hypothetical protein